MSFYRTKTGKLKTKKKTISSPRYAGYKQGQEVVIKVGKSKCQFVTPYPSPVEKAMAPPTPGYFFSPQFKNGNWDGRKHLITRAGYFPTGLLPLVYHVLKTGKNPMIEDGDKGKNVLTKPVEKVTVIIPDDMQAIFYPGMLDLWEDFDVLKTLNDANGTFAYPVGLLNRWAKVKNVNPLAKQILALGKSLVIKD
jgi:hypothetical protein